MTTKITFADLPVNTILDRVPNYTIGESGGRGKVVRIYTSKSAADHTRSRKEGDIWSYDYVVIRDEETGEEEDFLLSSFNVGPLDGPRSWVKVTEDLDKEHAPERRGAETSAAEYHDEIERHRVRQGSAVPLRRVATAASTLLLNMDVDEATGLGVFNEEREGLRTALRALDSYMEVEIEYSPLAGELAAEKAVAEMVCPKCHGTKRIEAQDVAGGRQWYRDKIFVACSRCRGSGQIDPFDFGIPTAQVARGRDAS